MKRLVPLLLCLILLAGCTQDQPLPLETEAPQQTETQPQQTTPPTQPPDPLEEILSGMSLEKKVGQLFLARCPDAKAVEDIEKYHLGGYILFARDFENETPESVKATISSYQSAASIPMLVAVDEEGGTVTRVSRYKAFRESPFLSPRQLYAQGGMEQIIRSEEEKCSLLASLGINVNVGPVCDVTTDPNAFMYPRSLGESPETTGEFVKTVVGIMSESRIGGILKHFPGYGNNTDTHVAIAMDDRSLSELESVDLIPFKAGIDAGCDAIMVSHVYVSAIDPELPATLSPAVHSYLRKNMGFDGVIVTDDLVMQAITGTYGAGEAAVLAVLAGNDLLCSTEYEVQYEAVLKAAQQGRITEEQLNESVLRLLRWKMELGLIQ